MLIAAVTKGMRLRRQDSQGQMSPSPQMGSMPTQQHQQQPMPQKPQSELIMVAC